MYNKTVLDHFQNPRNLKELKNPSATGMGANPVCGDVMTLYLETKGDEITTAAFKTMGCGAAIASGSILTEMLKGKTVEDAKKITPQTILEAMGELPKIKLHCPELAVEALRVTLNNLEKKEMTDKKKIIVAMSGGVDSSVAAGLLAREGHEVIGVTLKLLPRGGEGFGCCGSPDDVLLAKRSAEKAGIPHYVLDYSPEFEQKVINNFVNSYLIGETPNPCLACNRYIKFDKLKVFADSLGATHLATGHYARIEKDASGFHLYEAADPNKDQSYVLYNFNQTGLSSTLFPVGNKPKSEIRKIAHEMGLPNADKKDSQEICFVPKKDYRTFVRIKLEERAADMPETTRPGPIQNSDGQTIGEHKGVAYYTIGQKSGLGLNTTQRTYVTKLDATTNTVVVGSDQENLAKELVADDINWISGEPPAKEFPALIKIRYKHQPTPATVRMDGTRISVRFNEPQRAVTPGQAAVIYRWDSSRNVREVLGGGKIVHGL